MVLICGAWRVPLKRGRLVAPRVRSHTEPKKRNPSAKSFGGIPPYGTSDPSTVDPWTVVLQPVRLVEVLAAAADLRDQVCSHRL